MFERVMSDLSKTFSYRVTCEKWHDCIKKVIRLHCDKAQLDKRRLSGQDVPFEDINDYYVYVNDE